MESVPDAVVFKPTDTARIPDAVVLLPSATVSSFDAVELLPTATAVFPVASAPLPIPTVFKPVALESTPQATDPSTAVPGAFGAACTCTTAISDPTVNAANTLATTIFFLPE